MISAIDSLHIAFIGGGNMANAIIGGLLKQGLRPHQIKVVEPFDDTALKLREQFDITVLPAASIALAQADLMVWAVKPQVFKEAAKPVLPFASKALHLSVAAGIRTESIAAWLHSTRVVRCMPNTPALVGKGITALFALAHVSDQEKSVVEHIIRTIKQNGEPLILISHNMRQVFDLVDRIVVFRRGRIAANLKKSETNGEEVVAYITGAKTDKSLSDAA